jgi:hypothetical protein
MCRSDCLKSILSRVEAIERRRNCNPISIYQFNSRDLQVNTENASKRRAAGTAGHLSSRLRVSAHYQECAGSATPAAGTEKLGKSENPPSPSTPGPLRGIECLKKQSGLAGAVGDEYVGFSALPNRPQSAPKARAAGPCIMIYEQYTLGMNALPFSWMRNSLAGHRMRIP